MSSQSFFWAHVGLAIAIVLYFFVGRPRIKEPSRLNLRRGTEPQAGSPELNPSRSYLLSEEVRMAASGEFASEKSLNVMFLYNGHNFDAYEVLGLPAGSRREQVESAYRRALSASAAESHGFYEAALQAIRSELKRS